MSRKRKAFLDLDGTLIFYRHAYNHAKWKCGLIISRVLGVYSPDPQTVLRMQEETDVSMRREYGFRTDRFPSSWVRTYTALAIKYGRPVDPLVCQRLLTVAGQFKDGPFKLFDGALELLTWLHPRYERVLVTEGDRLVQNNKLDVVGLRPYLEDIYITGQGDDDRVVYPDKAAALSVALDGSDPTECFVCGDSRGSEIRAGIAMGIPSIWLHGLNGNTWIAADAELDPRTHYTVQSLDQVPALLECIHHL